MVKITPIRENSRLIIPNKINEARYKMSLLEQRFLLYIISSIGNPEHQINETDFEINVRDFIRFTKTQSKDVYSQLKITVSNINQRPIEYYDADTKAYKMVFIVEQVSYIPNSGLVGIRITRTANELLREMKKNFTQSLISEVVKFSSTYAIRIYQLCCQHRFKNEVIYEIDELKKYLNISDQNYNHFATFRRRVLESAKTEINKISKFIQIDYELIKQGRKFKYIKFSIKSLQNEKENDNELEIYKFESLDIDDISTRLRSYGCDKKFINHLLFKFKDDLEIFDHIFKKIEDKKPKNPAGYINTLSNSKAFLNEYESIMAERRNSEEVEEAEVGINQDRKIKKRATREEINAEIEKNRNIILNKMKV